MFNVGAQLRKTRKKSNLTLDQLAATSGVDRGTISRIELGHVSPRIDTIGFLCEAMNTNLGAFFDLPDAAAEAQAAAERPAAANLASDQALAASLSHNGFQLPLPGDGKPELEGYWPVPSSFWRGLLEVLERFEVLLKNSREMILVTDHQGKLLYLSPPCEQILGYRPQELIGKELVSLIATQDLNAVMACQAALAAAPGESRGLDYRMRCKDGSWCLVSSRFTNQLNNPNVRAVVVNSLKVQAP